jgi:hypothetical protein
MAPLPCECSDSGGSGGALRGTVRPRGAASPPATGFPGASQRSQQWRRARCDTGRSAVTPPADGGDACSNLCSNGTTLLPPNVHRPAESRMFARFSDKRRRHLASNHSSAPYCPTGPQRSNAKTRPARSACRRLHCERVSDPWTRAIGRDRGIGRTRQRGADSRPVRPEHGLRPAMANSSPITRRTLSIALGLREYGKPFRYKKIMRHRL